jgi:hypothetical protein
MTPQMRTALVRGQVALGVPRPEAEDFARFVTTTLCAAQMSLANEKATVAAVASSALFERKTVWQDISTEVLKMQAKFLTFSENSSPTAPIASENTPEAPSVPIFIPG